MTPLTPLYEATATVLGRDGGKLAPEWWRRRWRDVLEPGASADWLNVREAEKSNDFETFGLRNWGAFVFPDRNKEDGRRSRVGRKIGSLVLDTLSRHPSRRAEWAVRAELGETSKLKARI